MRIVSYGEDLDSSSGFLVVVTEEIEAKPANDAVAAWLVRGRK